MQDEPVKIIVPVGSLGAGVRKEEVEFGIAQGAQAIATDAGSTDSGAAYLGLGMSKNNRESVRRDLLILMEAASRRGMPLIVGTCGQAGGDLNVDWTVDIVREVASELQWKPRIAVLYSEQEKDTLKAKNAAGKIKPLAPLGPLEDSTIDECEHIVAALGPEPYIAALERGADIVLGGRTTDTAVIACYALWKGAPKGPSWHAAKISECGAQCTVAPTKGSGVLISIDNDGFEVQPLSNDNRCDPHSVSAHMLYENSDPFRLTEPGGVLDVIDAVYEQADPRTVRVTGSRWEEQPYTMKLEGVKKIGYQTTMLVGIQDPVVLSRLGEFHEKFLAALNFRIINAVGLEPHEFHISLRYYGWNAVSGDEPPEDAPPPREVGVLFVATGETQDMANQIAKACNPYFFHFPIDMEQELPSYGFAFSPADGPRGPVFEFVLNHVVEADEAGELVRERWVEIRELEASNA
ncbi:MAG: DUF1446 domain-containing protein [Hyphomonadaceae bacterium]|nr:DUF1446 domain-containing protein [Hyphomonadaceae bacterium]